MKRALVTSLVIVCLLFAQMHAQTPAGGNEAANRRPVAERMAIRLLEKSTARPNAILFVGFNKNSGAARIITMEDGATLRNDGVAPDEEAADGIHSALISVDVEQLRRRQALTLAAKSLPIFVGRELVGYATAKLSTKPIAWKNIPPLPNSDNFVRPKKGKLALALPLAPVAAGTLLPFYPLLSPADVSTRHSLMITDANVVSDPARTWNPCNPTAGTQFGVWTFGHLMSELAKTSLLTSKETFVREWMEEWATMQTVNGFAVPARPKVDRVILAPWPKTASGDLDLGQAPFKLVAIVNRVDLAGTRAFDEDEGAGEGRFIFTLMGASDNGTANPADDLTCTELPFLVIFEYKLEGNSCTDVKQWAQQWKDLDRFPISSVLYRRALAAVTRQFTDAQRASTGLGAQWTTSLNQVRTNEIALANVDIDTPGLWEMREFQLSIGRLSQVTVKQTPDISFNGTTTLNDYAMANSGKIKRDNHIIPNQWNGSPFLAGAAPVTGTAVSPPTTPPSSITNFYWAGPLVSDMNTTPELRHHFSLNTCSGCHARETKTQFTHVSETGALSGFLTGIDVDDPFTFSASRHFDDLERRGQRMNDILNGVCFGDFFVEPVQWPH